MNSELKGNIFHKFALRSLKANKTRTIVTLIGIMLSMALFTAVIEGANSGQQFLVNAEKTVEGAWEGGFYQVDQEVVESIENDSRIKLSGTSKTVGWAEIENKLDGKPYVLIQSVDEDYQKVVSIIIQEGRMAENSSEIVIPSHLEDYGGVKVGDTLELQLGKRVYDGKSLTDHDFYMDGEELIDTETKTYTVVGICGRANTKMESYDGAGFMAYTVGAQEAIDTSVFFTLKNYRKIFEFLDEYAAQTSAKYGEGRAVYHTDLLTYKGISGNAGVMTTLYALAAILVILIMFGSVTLIYNSFSISVSERTKQFGILKSIGATKAQIRSAVLFEAFILSLGGIVSGAILGCVGIGLTLYFLSDSFTALFTYGDLVKMRLVISPIGLLIAAVICLITVLISAWIPAKKAIRISAIEAIRQTGDIKIKGRKVKTSKLTLKLFGFEGMMASKNFKRNRKRSRSVIISIFLSLLLFVSASSLSAYLMDTINAYAVGDTGCDIIVTPTYPYEQTLQELAEEISKVEGVDRLSYQNVKMIDVQAPSELVVDENEENPYFVDSDGTTANIQIGVIFVDDESFRQLCQVNNIDSEKYFGEEPIALLQNEAYYLGSDPKDGHTKMLNTQLFDTGKMPLEITYNQAKYVEDLHFSRIETGADGNDYAIYCRNEYDEQEECYKEIDAGQYSVQEYVTETKLTATEVINQGMFFMNSSTPFLIYPESQMEKVVDVDSEEFVNKNWAGKIAVMAKNHKEVNVKILNLGLNLATYDNTESYESVRMLVNIVRVFTYGFIILISLIAVANIFNTISTNVMLRRREIAMMRSVGLPEKGFRKMMNYECIIYGLRGMLWGLPISVVISYLMYRAIAESYMTGFYIPWYTLVIGIGSVFVVIFAAMWYAAAKIKRDNVIDALKNENI